MADAQSMQGARQRAQQLMQNATKGHGTTMARIGLAWAFPSLLAFSVGAFIKLGGEGLLPNLLVEASRISATIVLLISGVLALEIALYSIGDAIARKRTTWRIAWDIVLVLVVAPLETWTLYLLITGQPATGPVDLMRAAEAVMATAYLGTLSILPPTDRDFVRIIGSRAAERAMEKLELIPLDAVGMGRLYRIQAVGNDDTLSWGQRAEKLVSVMEELAPGEQERLYQQRIAELEAAQRETSAQAQRDIASVQERARQLTETAEREIAEANAQSHTSATQRTLDAVLALVATGKLPDWLIAERPDLADFSLASVAGAHGGRRGGSGMGGRAPNSVPARESSSPSQRQRAFLIEQGIEPSKAPEGKRGVWLRASDLEALTGGKSGSETPQALIRRLGDGLKVGVAYVAPFEPVMRELAERHLLADAPRIWWASQIQSADDTGMDAVGHPAANVIPMRA